MSTEEKSLLTNIPPKFREFNNKGNRIIDLHILRGTLTGDVCDLNQEQYDIGQEEGGIWDNVSQHCYAAMLIANIFCEAFGVPEDERTITNLAAWFHDSGKKTERMWQRTIDEIEQPSDVSTQKKRALQDVELMEEWENTVDAGFPPIVSKLMKANIPPSVTGHETLPEKILWFADACLTGTTIKPIRERFDDLENDPVNGERNRHFSDSFKEKYNGKSLYDVQRDLGDNYSVEFSTKLGIPPLDIYEWLNIRVKEMISKNQSPLIT